MIRIGAPQAWDEPPKGACGHYVNANGKCFVPGCWNHA